MERWISFLGLSTMLALAWLCSDNRRKMNVRLIVSGVALQLLLAVVLLKSPAGEAAFRGARTFVLGLIRCSDEGAKFVFGSSFYAPEFTSTYGTPFFVSVLSTVVFFSTLTAVLFHLGVLQWLVKAMARVMVWVMDTSGAESLCASANVFIGMTTAPLVIRPYLQTMTRSELMAMMTGGMATVAGGTMAAYANMGADPGHLMVASLLSAPASLVVAKMMVPETESSPTKGTVKIAVPKQDANILDAACRGAGEGLKLSLNIAAMLIAFIALVYLLNWGLAGLSHLVDWGLSFAAHQGDAPPTLRQFLGGRELSLQLLLGWAFAPVAWIMGVEPKDAQAVGMLLGEKTIFNEFVAYQHLSTAEVRSAISPRSFVIATYALCGFANFGSIAVMIGGIGGLVPTRRSDFAKYGFRSLIGGTLAAFMTACIAGMLI
ncbi:MAG: NupC/NupG family nucleoside CNT transporter [Pirellulales bacterium]|nr:NupC/NupG family nucleoside CNT transporter [Pirellulales bacterium]